MRDIKKAKFLHHKSCPRCNSRDNVGVYSDGSEWCFGGCGYFKSAERTLANARKHDDDPIVYVDGPQIDPRIPTKALAWLRKYSLTDHEIDKHIPGYWYARDLLIVYRDDRFWQGRSFGEQVKTKYTSKGTKPEVIYGEGSPLVMVEDVISAIRVGRYTSAMPLFGSHIDAKALNRAVERFGDVALWLDPDKTQEAVRAASRANVVYPGKVGVAVTTVDPKATPDSEIKHLLGK